jgi:hypothetical protein
MKKWKMSKRKVTLDIGSKRWNRPLEGKEQKEFSALLKDLGKLRKIRCPWSSYCTSRRTMQITHPDGDWRRIARWHATYFSLSDGHVECRLVTGKKTQVAHLN